MTGLCFRKRTISSIFGEEGDCLFLSLFTTQSLIIRILQILSLHLAGTVLGENSTLQRKEYVCFRWGTNHHFQNFDLLPSPGLAGKGCSVSECLSTSLTTTENKTAWLGAVAQQFEEADLKAGNSGVHSWRAAITTVLASNPNLQCP